MAAIPSKLRNVTASALSGSAKALSLSSRLLEGVSGKLRPAQRPGEAADEAHEEAWNDARGRGRKGGGDGRQLRADDGPGPVAHDPESGQLAAAATGDAGESAGGPEPAAEDTGEATGDAGDAAGQPREAVSGVQAPPTEPVAGVSEHARTSETHVEELAAGAAADVISAVANLSTDELERLYAYEQRNKKRKTVLQAIERTVRPGAGENAP